MATGSEATTTAPRRVLLIDPDADAALLASMQIERAASFQLVGWAPDIAKGRAEIIRLQPDVVLLDRNLPDGDGLDLLEGLRDVAHRARFVLLTTMPAFTIAATARHHGVALIDKLDLARLPAKLEAALGCQSIDLRYSTPAPAQLSTAQHEPSFAG